MFRAKETYTPSLRSPLSRTNDVIACESLEGQRTTRINEFRLACQRINVTVANYGGPLIQARGLAVVCDTMEEVLKISIAANGRVCYGPETPDKNSRWVVWPM